MTNHIDSEASQDLIADAVVVEPEAQEQAMFYFSACVRVTYVRDDKPRERTVNVNAALPMPFITKQTLLDFSRAAMQRTVADMGITESALRETVLLGVSPLGHMPPSVFSAELELHEDSE